MATINSYLNFNGNTEEAFNFYKSVFGGEFTTLQRLKDTPEADKISANDREKIMHVALPIGSNLLMGTDVLESMPQVKFGPKQTIYSKAFHLVEKLPCHLKKCFGVLTLECLPTSSVFNGW